MFLARLLGGHGSTSPAPPSAPAACGDCGCGFAGAPSKTGRGHHHCCPPYIRRCRPPNKRNAGSRKCTSSTRAVAWFVSFLGYPSAKVHNGRCLLSKLKVALRRRAQCCRDSSFSTNVDRSGPPWSSCTPMIRTLLPSSVGLHCGRCRRRCACAWRSLYDLLACTARSGRGSWSQLGKRAPRASTARPRPITKGMDRPRG